MRSFPRSLSRSLVALIFKLHLEPNKLAGLFDSASRLWADLLRSVIGRFSAPVLPILGELSAILPTNRLPRQIEREEDFQIVVEVKKKVILESMNWWRRRSGGREEKARMKEIWTSRDASSKETWSKTTLRRSQGHLRASAHGYYPSDPRKNFWKASEKLFLPSPALIESESREPIVGASTRPDRLSAQTRLAEMQVFAERNCREECRLSANLSATPSCGFNGLQVYFKPDASGLHLTGQRDLLHQREVQSQSNRSSWEVHSPRSPQLTFPVRCDAGS